MSAEEPKQIPPDGPNGKPSSYELHYPNGLITKHTRLPNGDPRSEKKEVIQATPSALQRTKAT